MTGYRAASINFVCTNEDFKKVHSCSDCVFASSVKRSAMQSNASFLRISCNFHVILVSVMAPGKHCPQSSKLATKPNGF